MYKPSSSLRGGTIHHLAGILEPGWTHDHSLSALPVDLAFFDMLVLKMIEQTTRQQRQQGKRKSVRLFALKTIITGHIAIGSRKKNNAEDPFAHCLALSRVR